MRMKKLFLLLIALVLMLPVKAQEMSRPQVEEGRLAEVTRLYEANEVRAAFDLVKQELEENKRNGYAYFLMGLIIWDSSPEELKLTEMEARLVYDANVLLQIWNRAIKYLPKKDLYYKSVAYFYKAKVLQSVENFDESNKMLDKAFALNKDIEFLQEKGQNYIFMGKYDVAKAMFEETNSIKPTSANCVGIAVACINLGQYDEAIEMARKAVGFADDRMDWALAQMARAYVLKGDLPGAIEPAVDSYMISQIDWVGELLEEAKNKHPELLVSRLKIALIEHPSKEVFIKDFLSRIYYWELDDCRNAIKYAEEVKQLEPTYLYPYSILALSHVDLGEYDKALCDLDTWAEMDSLVSGLSSLHYLYHMAYYGQGKLDKSLESINQAIALDPEKASFYQLRGEIYRYMGRIDDAIDDYTMALTLDSTVSYYFLSRGVLLKQQNKNVAAAADFYKVVELNSGRGGETAYAYFYLGDSAKALETLVEGYAEKRIDDYNAACLYSLLGQKEVALRYLERSLDNGFRNFNHIDRDEDFDNIRDLPEFEALIERYKN
jgi:tetratricopeptide (TPR) repeat protein